MDLLVVFDKDLLEVIDELDAALEERKQQMAADGSAVEGTDLEVTVVRKRSKDSAEDTEWWTI